MNTTTDHPDIEKLPLEIDGIPVRETIREIFRNSDNGTPDNISRAGCLTLAFKSNEIGGQEKGHVVWNEWRVQFPVKTDNGVAKNFANFYGLNFKDRPISFRHFNFGDHANFSNTQWGASTNFASASWGESCQFRGTQWNNLATFVEAKWGKAADFTGAQWDNYANFRGARWGKGAYFTGAQWGVAPCFSATEWGDGVNFCGLDWNDLRFVYANDDQMKTAKEWAEHRSLSPQTFPNGTDFSGAKFLGKANFSNRQFKGSLRFSRLPDWYKKPNAPDLNTRTNFGAAPVFHGCEFHQDTSFEGAIFAPATGSEEAARAYRTLKLAFSKQQATRQEQQFFLLEMEEETLRETGLKRVLFRAYKTFSDYGFSITRPLKYWGLGVLGLTTVYGLLSWWGQCDFSMQGCRFSPGWLEFSLLQTLPLLGLDKLSATAGKEFWPAGAWWDLALSAMVVAHKTISIAALFLIGLALRNLFKLK